MTKKAKNILKGLAATAFLLVVVIGLHIYYVTRPHISEKTLAMARIDFKQDINTGDAEKITTWLYGRQGVQKVLCNPGGKCVVFTFYPARANATHIAAQMRSELRYDGERYLPTDDEMKGGCPISPQSFTYKVYTFFQNII